MIKILIIDDSDTEVQLLKGLFAAEKDFQVVGSAKNGKLGVELVSQLQPDIITMDLQMPVMDGLEAIRNIMAHQPTPIVVISSKLQSSQLDVTFEALNAGALSVLEKPLDFTSQQFMRKQKSITDTIRAMADIKVVRRKFKPLTIKPVVPFKTNIKRKFELIAIGTSVGGPQALFKILTQLPKNFPVPIVIVQHMIAGYMGGFANWLNANIELTVKEAENLEVLRPGIIYLAPDHKHLVVDRINDNLIAKLTNLPAVNGFCPSVSVLLNSVSKICGERAVGILLTGMGFDGADGLLNLKKQQGHTIIQDKESAVVFGMAGVAKSYGAVDKEVKIDKIAEYLCSILQ